MKKKKTQQNEQNKRRRNVSIASSDKTQELEDPPASFKSAVWEHFGFPVDYNNDGGSDEDGVQALFDSGAVC